jgi:predicted GIY-YIG superfamily endonuclease
LHNLKDAATYNGYTVDFDHRLRQHNCLIKGGAKFTSRLVRCKQVAWLPLAIVCVPCASEAGFDHARALSLEWSIKYPDNRRPRPAAFNGAQGRLRGLARVFENPKFADLAFDVRVFTQGAREELERALGPSARGGRVVVRLDGEEETTAGMGEQAAAVDVATLVRVYYETYLELDAVRGNACADEGDIKEVWEHVGALSEKLRGAWKALPPEARRWIARHNCVLASPDEADGGSAGSGDASSQGGGLAGRVPFGLDAYYAAWKVLEENERDGACSDPGDFWIMLPRLRERVKEAWRALPDDLKEAAAVHPCTRTHI